jgi:pimeloyl-ACP methyl ester carboxylesterase
MISSPADVASLRPRPWKAGALRQISLRNAVRAPRLSARGMFGRKLKAAEAVASLTMPKLIVSAEGDWLVDPSHARLLARAAAPPVDLVHLETPGSLHADALVRFLPLRILRVLTRWFKENAPP